MAPAAEPSACSSLCDPLLHFPQSGTADPEIKQPIYETGTEMEIIICTFSTLIFNRQAILCPWPLFPFKFDTCVCGRSSPLNNLTLVSVAAVSF